jgi:hypothetical protein
MSGRRALWWVALGALALRLTLLIVRGDYVVYDEGYYLLLERSLRAGHGYALNGLPHVALSPLQPLLVTAIAMAGVPDLWASRLLAAVCGAALVLPVAALARLAGGPKAALPAAILTAASPALMSFVPFFPGRSWNLYFGSEPLFLLLAFGAVAAAVHAESGGWKWWLAAGALASASYLSRLEGAVAAGALLIVLVLRLVARRAGHSEWRRLAAACLVGAVVAAPYLFYLRSTLGRWAVSGRVQAASARGAELQTAASGARAGGEVLQAFVWQGDPDAFLRALYGLDATGTRMASQYWGVRRDTGGTAAPEPSAHADGRAAPDTARPAPAAVRRGALQVWRQGLAAVVPWWFGAIALFGLALGGRRALVWVLPLAVCSLLPSALTYVEPRSLLPLAPLAAIYAGVAAVRLEERFTAPWARRAAVSLAGLAALGLLVPAFRDLAGAWSQRTPLQRVSSARRAVGEYLAQHLPADAIVMSWHPALAIWANRPWRVLPFDSFERIAAYAEAERASAIAFSRFEPSPIRRPPRPFTVVLLGSPRAAAAGTTVQLAPVDETPLLFVGRLARGVSP